ncbi:AAA family ATPase [Shouchella tritolerans]|uniref:AAA family ATPase n=1 Tax=Shouchella tritolerans TaxID=2979466 RepID=UPI0021E79279|nr:AAA family ATPase [Shouchella tritolerans]
MKLNNIVSVRLENFQSHLDSTLQFDKGLNVIVGQSDSGKTAVLRAVRWALFNQPRGTDFIRVGADFVRVTITMDSGRLIIRERTSSKNRYILKEPGGQDLVLEGFGSQVPEEVIQAHGMRPFRIDGDNEWHLQIAQQLDGPFLLEAPGSLRAKTIGRMSGAHYLDMAIRDTSKDVYGLSQRIKQKQAEVEEAKTALAPFDGLEKAKAKLDKGFEKLRLAKAAQERLAKLKQWHARYIELTRAKAEANKQKASVAQLADWEIRYEQLRALAVKSKRLSQLAEQWTRLEKDSSTCSLWLSKTAQVDSAYSLHQAIRNEAARYVRLTNLEQQCQAIKDNEQTLTKAMAQTAFVQSLDRKQLVRMEEEQAKKERLEKLARQWQQTKHEYTSVKATSAELKGTEQAAQQLNEATETTKLLMKLKDYKRQLAEVTKRAADGQAFVKEKLAEEKQLNDRYTKTLKALGICPTCGQAINHGGEHHG